MGPSRYLEYLPGLYRQDEFMGRFLLIFEDILSPLEKMVDNLPLYFDPDLCPEGLLDYLARWVSLALNERYPLEHRRRMVKAAAEFYRWRGTRRGLKAFLEAVTGVTPLIVENTDGIRLGQDCRLGLNSRLGSPIAHCVAVTLPVEGEVQVDRAEVEALLEAEKPAHTVYLLHIVPRQTQILMGVIMSDGEGSLVAHRGASLPLV